MGSTILSINSNISSLRAQRQVGVASNALSSTFEKLSSGLRINKASDDAAGLAVASSLKADSRIYSQGIRNLNDGVSALNIADGALSNLSSIVTRMAELAEQSANGAVGTKQRKSLDEEAQALAKEYVRIARTTDFNGLNLFDGSIQGLTLQAGYGSNETIAASLGGAIGTGTFQSATSYASLSAQAEDVELADLNGDGILDLITSGTDSVGAVHINIGNGDGSFKASYSYLAQGRYSHAVEMSDLNNDGTLDMVSTGGTFIGGLIYWRSTSVRLGNGDGTFRSSFTYQDGLPGSFSMNYDVALSDLNNDGFQDMVTVGTSAPVVAVRLGNGDGSFRASSSFAGQASAVSVCDVNGDGVADLVTASNYSTIHIGNGDGSFRAIVSYKMETGASQALSMGDINGDGYLDMVTAGDTSGDTGSATIRLGNGDGTFRDAYSYGTESLTSYSLSLSDINGDSVLDLLTSGEASDGKGYSTIRLGNGDGTFSAPISYLAESDYSSAITTGDLNGDGVVDLVTAGEPSSGSGNITVRLANTKDGVSPILTFSLTTQAGALQALPVFKHTLDRLSMQRGQIGASQSRLSSALSTLSSKVLQYQGAQSRVEDVDVASESANLIKQQIVQQAASSVLAQANQGPKLALALLQT